MMKFTTHAGMTTAKFGCLETLEVHDFVLSASDLKQLRDPTLILSHVFHVKSFLKVTRVCANHGRG